MSRTARIELAGGIHHVWQRGNNRRQIFHDVPTRRFFLSLWRECGERYGWRRLSYCLMGNHFHLIVETPQPTLGEGMRDLEGRYAQWFNDRYETGGGHLFQSRFGSRLVPSDGQLAHLLAYVARNPVRAGLCAHPADWPWSSHRALLGGGPHPLVACERVTELLAPFGGYARLFEPGGPLAHLDLDVSPWEVRPALSEILAGPQSDEAIAIAREHGYRLAEIAAESGLSISTVWRRSQSAARAA